jgi:hypothetical protein
MAIVMNMRWDGVTPEQYDAMLEAVNWEDDPADGGIFHVAWFQDGSLRVVDVWEEAAQFEAFVGNRLMPGVAELGVEGQPDVDIQPVHRVFDVAANALRA